ncbi:sugar-binding protein [Salipaludibacillus agaradhaerens]|uniref:Sugar-binding protein n=1 Tax=Salipaludibacillus agaradhaerens TaxID=76935 RepID=A0A9Q4AYD9_SALAG|nr:multiple monosaccharide ABC transporter substrate-binding protein [Salipaludibacillus agaradhaerens]MCR6094994.1 sugar-binding protein [Salipaludibacillus agaradhaerens]MCR6115448.1 sugar-binding protein [Salipaludibacillus agaradhaerens]
MKRYGLVMMAVIIAAMLISCSSNERTDSEGKIGLALPTQSSERWVKDGENMVKEFEELGYDVDIQYGEDVVENQIDQIENMITQGADLIVIASIDGEALTSVLEMAEASDIPIIAYDRLIMNSEHVSYYATFDNYQVGVLQGQYIEEQLGLNNGEGPFTIELFAGSPDDNNAYFFWDGAMSVLEPYMDEGLLNVKSGQDAFEQGATLRWDGSLAQERMDNILSAHYADTNLDAVYSPYDGISRGIISSLTSVGYGSDNQPLPVITGQDAELSSVKSIIAGEQTQTVFKDTRELARQAVNMADAVLRGEEPEVNDTETYDNGVKVVPSYLIEPISIDKDNYEDILVGSGYFTEEELR